MHVTTENGIDLCYETFGDRSARPLILIIGLATQMIAWPDPFCRMLAEAGHFVIRFDNRDIGHSFKMTNLGLPDLERLMADAATGRPVQAPYTLSDMAADTVGLMDGLGLGRAHICGMSMGGMIGQVMALDYPKRVRSLISMMSTTNEQDLPSSTQEAQEAMMGKPPADRAAYQAYMGRLGRAFAGGSDKYDETMQRDTAGQAFDRGVYPEGFVRQMAAIIAAEGRRDRLKKVKAPTLVIHGECDTVVPPEHGRDTADAIPDARLLMMPGLGHGPFYPDLWADMVGAIADHTAGAER
jgi:pimeloyl-ACP methyl ester carboxylesterase